MDIGGGDGAGCDSPVAVRYSPVLWKWRAKKSDLYVISFSVRTSLPSHIPKVDSLRLVRGLWELLR